MIYVDPTAPGVNGARVPGMEGGGNVQRSMVQTYHRVYLNHLAMLPEQGYRVKAADADKCLFKDYISFSAPALSNETSVLRWRGAIGLDVLDSSTSLAIATTPTAIPTMTDKHIERKFSISNLSGGR